MGGPLWPEFENQITARHCRAGRPFDIKPTYELAKATVNTPSIWLGPACTHFGHQIYDFSGRILHSLRESHEENLLIGLRTGNHSLPPIQLAILDWYGINIKRVKVINTPIIYKELHVFPQEEQPLMRPKDSYLDSLQIITHRNLPDIKQTEEILYISRSKIHAHMAGESYIEDLMKLSGIKIVHPELLSLKQQLSYYYKAGTLIFSEGSALHGLQLLGRIKANVIIINRRPRSNLGLVDFLPDRVNSLNYIDAVKDLITSYKITGMPALAFGISIINHELLLDELKNYGVNLYKNFNYATYMKAVKKDISDWVTEEIKTPRSKNPGSHDRLIYKLKKYDLELNS